MKKYLIFLLLLLLSNTLTFAQAPQGLNYQAVAYNGSGVPVPNQLLGVRLSILDGSATGTLVYQETQGPTTDNTGLFSIVIGNGTVVSGTFASINWGNGSKWLKTEIDITGGSSYVVMGVTQFMSVPYALYANSSGTSGIGSPSFTMPDGFKNSTNVILGPDSSYIVPLGKNLYVSLDYILLIDNIDGVSVTYGLSYISNVLGIGENSVIRVGSNGTISGTLVDKKVEWFTINLNATSFTVPANKQFVVQRSWGQILAPCSITVNGVPLGSNSMLSQIVLDQGTVISSNGCSNTAPFPLAINGYLIDR